MPDLPTVSVVIPAYNAAAWIAEAIESVRNQEFLDHEIIVVDDGSTDDTAQVVAAFHGSVHYIHKENGGQSSARNVGIKHARGRYIAFLDADDLWMPNKLSLQMAQLRTNGRMWVYCDATAFDGQSGRMLYRFGRVAPQHKGDVLALLFLQGFIPPSSPVVQRSVFDEVGYFDEHPVMRFAEDWDMWLRIAARYPVDLVPQSLVAFRVHPTSTTGREDPLTMIQGDLRAIENAVTREPTRLRQYKRRALAYRYRNAGMILARTGRLNQARSAFATAIRLAPTRVETYVNWAACYMGGWPLKTAIQLRYWLRRVTR